MVGRKSTNLRSGWHTDCKIRNAKSTGAVGISVQLEMTPQKVPATAEQVSRPVGEMEERVYAYDWSRTPIGAYETWSPALRTVVRVLLASRFPQLLWWGPEYVSIYNDAYRPILGGKHPWGLGQPVRQCWSEIWSVLKPLIDTPFRGGPATWMDDLELEIRRSGFTEETHFTVAYSPVPDDSAPGGIGGVLATVHEITEKVVGERRTIVLRELGTRVAEAKTAEEACRVAAASLARHSKDVPFALFYVTDLDGRQAHLAASSGFHGEDRGPSVIHLEADPGDTPVWPLAAARQTGRMQLVENPSPILRAIPHGPWADPTSAAAVVPIRSSAAHRFSGYLVAGLSSRLKFDESYRSFLELATSQVASAVANARAYEEERRRTEVLAGIDRAKTAFFSNVSHEFRTPLTLILGPLEAILAKNDPGPEDRGQIVMAHRNGMRLMKLVNSLLDFARLEAGRAKAEFVPVDLPALTCDIASSFRSVLEAAGLALVVDCPALPQPVYVDREMWEKIVLNLLSNAFKFTFVGRITVRLRASGDQASLSVEDTGTGIPEKELPHIFERFHRVEAARGRIYEGSGIGLALVQEMVKLHGGTITAESRPGYGTVVSVAVPLGCGHLPDEQVSTSALPDNTTVRREAFAGEALSWLAHPSDDSGRPRAGESSAAHPRVLLADDNADMRDHISRILGNGYEVTAVGDGMAALQAAQEKVPDIVLADVMMPVLDGFGLLREVRADPRLREVPVLLVSARAGEEARTEGIEAGADDYIVKPFSARELVARVEGTLNLQRVRRESVQEIARSEARFRAFVTATSDVIYRMSSDWREMRLLHGKDFIADTERPSRTWLEEYIHPDDHAQVLSAIRAAIRDKTVFQLEHQVIRVDGSRGWTFSRAVPLLNENGEIVEWFGAARDITAQKAAEQEIRDAAERLRFMAESMPQKIFTAAAAGEVTYFNRQWMDFTGLSFEQIRGWGWTQFIHPDDVKENVRVWRAALASGEPFQFTHRFRRADGEYRWHLSRALPMRGADGKITMWIGSSTEIHDQKRIEEELRRANQDLEQFAYSASHDLQEPLRGIKIFSELLEGRYRSKLEGRAVEFLDNVRQSALRMEQLLQDLLTYTQVAKFEPPSKLASAQEALQAALVSLSSAISEAGAKVEADSLPFLPVNPAHLQQLFQNLVGNAVKYRRRGVPIEARVTARRQGGEWLLAVRDNGIGIEPEYKETIFGLFKRLHSADQYSGTGMGLAICQRIVERYHGRIWVESEPGKGSTFFFTLPAGPTASHAGADSGSGGQQE